MRARRPTRDTHRLLLRVREGIRVGVNDLALDLVGPAAIVSQTAHDAGDIALGHGDGLAVVERLDGGEQVDVLLQEVGEVDQVLAPVLGCLLSPHALEGLARRGDGYVDILLGGLGHGADDLLRGRVDGLEGLAVDRRDPLVVDEPGGEEGRQHREGVWGVGE